MGKEVDFMPNILPVSDLRNYNEVLKNCQIGEPVFLTKNGRGKFVVMEKKKSHCAENTAQQPNCKKEKTQ